MSVAQHAPTSTPTRKHRKPDPARVYQVFLHESSTAGRRNAASRTASAFGLSDDTIRRIVAKFEKVDDTPPEVQYQPAPGQVEYETQRERQARELAAKLPQTDATAAASVKPEPQAGPHAIPDDLRTYLMSNTTDFELEMRQLMGDTNSQQPQPATPQCRSLVLEDEPQTDATAPQHREPSISITADYVRRRDTAQLARRGLDLSTLGDALMFMVGPVPVVAWLVFGLVVLLLAGR